MDPELDPIYVALGAISLIERGGRGKRTTGDGASVCTISHDNPCFFDEVGYILYRAQFQIAGTGTQLPSVDRD